MGDAGAMFLGLLLAVTTITIGGRTADQFSGPDLLLLRAAPHPDRDPRRADRRHRRSRSSGGCRARQSCPRADREHLHHRLMRLGHGPRRVGRDPVALDRAGLGGRPHPDLHQPGQLPRADRPRRARAAPLHLLPPGRASRGRRRGARTAAPPATPCRRSCDRADRRRLRDGAGSTRHARPRLGGRSGAEVDRRRASPIL